MKTRSISFPDGSVIFPNGWKVTGDGDETVAVQRSETEELARIEANGDGFSFDSHGGLHVPTAVLAEIARRKNHQAGESDGCTLCTSWAHCPANPASDHPRPHQATEIDVEVALLTGFTWGVIDGGTSKLCVGHTNAVREAITALEKIS